MVTYTAGLSELNESQCVNETWRKAKILGSCKGLIWCSSEIQHDCLQRYTRQHKFRYSTDIVDIQQGLHRTQAFCNTQLVTGNPDDMMKHQLL